MAKNPEVRENQEAPETREELNNLERQVSWDRRKFETLLKSPSLKKWMEKIMKKWLDSKIQAFIETSNWKVDYYIWTMIEKHPELVSFIGWELNLPVKIWESSNKVKFSQLSFEQKLSFMALVEFYWDNVPAYKNIKPSKIIEGYRKYMNKFSNQVTEHFNTTMENNEDFLWLWYVNIEKVLKNEYWLTETESKKMKEYVELIQEHPEYVKKVTWWYEIKPQLAWIWTWTWILIWILIWIALSAWWYITYKYISNLVKVKDPETKVYWDHTEITNFEKTFKVMSAVALTDSEERLIHEDGFGHVDLWFSFLKPVEWLINWAADVGNRTGLENRDLVMRIKCENYYMFDFKWAKCFLEKKNWKRMVHLKWVKKPEVKTNVTDVEILESHREKIINLKKFDDFEIKAQNILKDEANKTASTSDKIAEAEKSLWEQILWVFQTLWCHNSDVDVEWKDIQGIIIDYEVEQPNQGGNQRPTDVENRRRIVNN